MTERKTMIPSILIVALMHNGALAAADTNSNGVIVSANIIPRGHYYETTVPDTLDLAERARLAVHGLTSFLNEKKGYSPYGHAHFNSNPAYLTNKEGADGAWNWGKIAEGLAMARLMSGSEKNLDLQRRLIEGMIAYTGYPDRITMHPTALARVLLALLALQQSNPNLQLQPVLRSCYNALCSATIPEDGYAYFAPYDYNWPPDSQDTAIGVMGYGQSVFHHGTPLRALSRWYDCHPNQQTLNLAEKIKNFLLKSKFWQPEAEGKVFTPAEHAHFMGHTHSYTAALMGLLLYAQVTRDVRLMQFVRDGYEFMRNLGIARLGLFGEMCTTGDMTFLALKLSDLGVGDYWDDADQYIRNHLTELQITDAGRLHRIVEALPPNAKQFDSVEETIQGVVGRCLGAFLSDSSYPTCVPTSRLFFTICCTGNCTAALYFAWESIVRHDNGTAQVNLLLNRASPWLDLDSYLPYEGKVVIKNKTTRKLSVRLPYWVQKKAVTSRINDQPAAPFWAGNYLVFDKLNQTDTIIIEFPLITTVEIYTLKWKKTEFWMETNNPGHDWKPLNPPEKFTCHFKGNTLMEISPRPRNAPYPLYERRRYQKPAAPMKKVTRFVAAIRLNW